MEYFRATQVAVWNGRRRTETPPQTLRNGSTAHKWSPKSSNVAFHQPPFEHFPSSFSILALVGSLHSPSWFGLSVSRSFWPPAFRQSWLSRTVYTGSKFVMPLWAEQAVTQYKLVMPPLVEGNKKCICTATYRLYD